MSVSAPADTRSEGAKLLDLAMARDGLTGRDVSRRLMPHPDPTTVTRWCAGTRSPESRGHRVQLRELFKIPESAWETSEAEKRREAWLAKHPEKPRDPKQIDLPGTAEGEAS